MFKRKCIIKIVISNIKLASMFKNIYIKITNSELKFIIPFTDPSTLLSCMHQIVYAMSQISIYVNMFTDALRQKLQKKQFDKGKIKTHFNS